MADDDDDFDDLFAQFDADEALDSINISSNLLAAAGVKDEREEKSTTWVAPTAAGLHNSTTVTSATSRHWQNAEAITPQQAVESALPEDADAAAASSATGRAEAESALWQEAGISTPKGGRQSAAMSANLMVELGHVTESLDEDAAREVADLFERLAAHGHGVTVLSKPEFNSLVAQLTSTPEGRELVRLLSDRKRRRKSVAVEGFGALAISA